MSGRRRRVTYRPNKVNSVMGGVVGAIFVLIGIFVAIPNFGVFGIFWTACAAVITATNFYQAFGSKYIGPEIEIEDEPEADNTQARLEKLRKLYESSLISREEYEEKRKEILKEL